MRGSLSSQRDGVQSSSPNDITIKATCENDDKKIAEYKFTVCAHPKNFYIDDHPDNMECNNKRIGPLVKWNADSDSGTISDLGKVIIYEVFSLVVYVDGLNPGFQAPAKLIGDNLDDLEINRDCRCTEFYVVPSSLPDDTDEHLYLHGGHSFKCNRCGVSGKLGIDEVHKHYWIEGIINPFRMDVDEDGWCVKRCDKYIDWHIHRHIECYPGG
ncbi:MAG TPA: hypothetical protein VM425_21995 [Myxococcota bacterium]|nr:hypothetical protein [Myxococcota bacterium]